jgi:hypothetical protein
VIVPLDEGYLIRTIAFASFPQDEQDIFRSSCRRWGKRLDEFLVKPEKPDPVPGPKSASQREVTVAYSQLVSRKLAATRMFCALPHST